MTAIPMLERRRRVESALVSMLATSYLLGVSTRRMEKLVQALGITGLSKSQVSEMAKDLDSQVEAFRTRPLDVGPYIFVAADALVLKVRESTSIRARRQYVTACPYRRKVLGLRPSARRCRRNERSRSCRRAFTEGKLSGE
jgi:transposase-like protein